MTRALLRLGSPVLLCFASSVASLDLTERGSGFPGVHICISFPLSRPISFASGPFPLLTYSARWCKNKSINILFPMSLLASGIFRNVCVPCGICAARVGSLVLGFTASGIMASGLPFAGTLAIWLDTPLTPTRRRRHGASSTILPSCYALAR